MRFRVGAIPEPPGFVPEAPWRGLREPSVWVAQFIATPIGIVITAVVAITWFLATSPEGRVMPESLLDLLLSFVLIVVVHELIHVVTHPGQGRTSRTMLGVWPSKFLFYAHYEGELTRNRFVTILLMPFICISVAPLIVFSVFGNPPGWVVFASVFNALCACVDVLGAGLVLYQIPGDAIVQNHGWRTYWRYPDEVANLREA